MSRAEDRRSAKAEAKQWQYIESKFQQGVVSYAPYPTRGNLYPYASAKRGAV